MDTHHTFEFVEGTIACNIAPGEYSPSTPLPLSFG
jgi:hypothetical protein